MERINLILDGTDSFSVQEAYKVLRANLQFCGNDTKVIAITSCNENEGKTTVSLNIAKSLSELDKKVLIIDCDMRKSVLAARYTNVVDIKGLSEVLSGQSDINDCLHRTNYNSLYLLASGKYPPNPVELLSNQKFDLMLESAREIYDYVIIDTPPLSVVIDAAVIAKKCDGVVLIIGDEKLKSKKAQEVVEQLKKSECRILGVVLNNSKKNRSIYSKTGRYYYTGS